MGKEYYGLEFHVDEYRHKGITLTARSINNSGLGVGDRKIRGYPCLERIFITGRADSGCAMACVLSKIASM